MLVVLILVIFLRICSYLYSLTGIRILLVVNYIISPMLSGAQISLQKFEPHMIYSRKVIISPVST